MKQLFSTNRKSRRSFNGRVKHRNAKNAYRQVIQMDGTHKVIHHLPKKSDGVYKPKTTA